MKHSQVRQLVRELIKEAFVDASGNLSGFETPDEELGIGTTDFFAGLENAINALKKIPDLERRGMLGTFTRAINGLKELWEVSTEKERNVILSSIPGNNTVTKAEIMAFATIASKYDSLFNIFVAPYLDGKDPEEDLFENITTDIDIDIVRQVSKKLAQLGIIK